MTVTFSHPSGCRSNEDSEADESPDEEEADEDENEDFFAETKADWSQSDKE